MAKWYENPWVWVGAGVGAFVFLREKSASAAKPPWDPMDCLPATLALMPLVDKLKRAGRLAFGNVIGPEVCVEKIDWEDTSSTVPAEVFNITLQVGKDGGVAVDTLLIAEKSEADLAAALKTLV